MFNDLFNVQTGHLASAAIDQSQAEELAKTLTIGHANGLNAPGSLVGGAALQMESMDATLKSVTYDASHLVLWPSVPQDRAYSLVEQFVRTNSYGDSGSVFVPEAGSPQMNDSEYNRHAVKVVFMATRRGVSLPSTLVRMNFGGDIEGREAQAGTLWMLERLERALYKSHADFVDASGEFTGSPDSIPSKIQNLELSGLEHQIRNGDSDYTAQVKAFEGYGAAQSVIKSVKGEALAEGDFEELANILVENFGHPNECHMAPRQISDFIKQFYPKERVNPMGVLDGRAGYIVRTMSTTAGDINLKANVFLKPKENPKAQADRPGTPGAPASASASQAASDSGLKSGDKYVYVVTACNEQGEGAAAAQTSQVTVSADGNAVSVAIASPTSGAGVTHYAVYRTSANGSGAPKFIAYIKRSGATTTFVDKGRKIEGAATGYMLENNPDVMVWKQLAPLTRVNLAQLSLAKEFVLWLAGCLIVFKPRALGVFENIGKSA